MKRVDIAQPSGAQSSGALGYVEHRHGRHRQPDPGTMFDGTGSGIWRRRSQLYKHCIDIQYMYDILTIEV